MSAMKHGTPAWLKVSASTWRDTVFPVPVAPAIRPCLLAMRPLIHIGPCGPCAIYNPFCLSYISCISSSGVPTNGFPVRLFRYLPA